MGELRPGAIEWDAATVAGAPILGFRLSEFDQDGVAYFARLSQPWIAVEDAPVTIDARLFADFNPIAAVLPEQVTHSWIVDGLAEALSEFVDQWAISSVLLSRTADHNGPAAVIVGADLHAVVWRHGMVVGVNDALATLFHLLGANFGRPTMSTFTPEALRAALDLLPENAKTSYTPGADEAIANLREQLMHNTVLTRQANLKKAAARKPKIRIKPGP
jgi:hypothetical protein